MEPCIQRLQIVVDTREKHPLKFPEVHKCYDGEWAITSTVSKLDTADYSLVGYENEIAIERKATPDEIAQNFTKHRERFFAEMSRFRGHNIRVLLCEFPLEDITEHRYLSKLSPSSLLSTLDVIGESFGVYVRFAESREAATKYVIDCFRRFAKRKMHATEAINN